MQWRRRKRFLVVIGSARHALLIKHHQDGCNGSGSGGEDDAPGGEVEYPDHQQYNGNGSYARATQRNTVKRAGGVQGGGYYNNKQHYHPRSYGAQDTGAPLVTTEKQIFNEEEYTKITTPRQDVLFKKGYLGRKKPTTTTTTATATPPESDAAATPNGDETGGHNDESLDGEHHNGMLEDQHQYIYNGFIDQSGVYYINGSSYEMYDPYTNQITVIVGPAHYGHHNGGPPVLAAVPCQPVPLQPVEWFNPAPPGFLPYVQAPQCPLQPVQRDRRKRYSTDSQNCSPQSSEPPGSPQESDEVAATQPGQQMYQQHPAYVYPGYMFGAPMYNMNGVTVQSTPNQAPSSDVNGKRRKKKRRRRRRRNGVEDGSEESSSDEKDPEEEPTSLTSQESSLESDSKLSLSGEESTQPPLAVREPLPSPVVVNGRTSDSPHTFQQPPPPVATPPLPAEVAKPLPPLAEAPKSPPPPAEVCEPLIVTEERLVNGHDKAPVILPPDPEFERYEDFQNGTAEEEWITVKAKQGRKVENGLSNGHAKAPKENGIPRVNGVHKPKERLYKNCNGKVSEEKCVQIRGKNLKSAPNGRVKTPVLTTPAIAMDGNEGSVTNESSSEAAVTPPEVPPKPGRKDRKKITTPLKATAKPFEMPSVSLRPETCIKPVEVVVKNETTEDNLLAALTLSKSPVDVPKTTEAFTSHEGACMQKIPSLKDLSTKSIPKEETKLRTEDFLSEERKVETPVVTPVAPPRRKKWRTTNKRLERAPTPGKTNDDSLEESSSASSTSSQESEESVIECLSSGLNSPEAKHVSSSDDEVIYSGKLGVNEPEPVGILKTPKTPEPDMTPEVLEIAKEIVDTVIEKAVEESSRLKQEERPITEAVTRWLRSQSPDVLTIPEEVSGDEEDEADEEDVDDNGSKNLQGNPLPVSSVDGNDAAGTRVANKNTDTLETTEEEDVESTPSGEWDLWEVSNDRQDILRNERTPDFTKYDPLANDTFTPVEGNLLESPNRCTSMCDPSISVAKYYVLGPPPDKSSPVQDVEASDSDDALEEYRGVQGPYKVSLATELARLEQPLPKSWAVAPLSVEKRCDCKCKCKEQVQDSGIESGDEAVLTGGKRQSSVFRRKVTGRLTGEGAPFPCGGICCIVQ